MDSPKRCQEPGCNSHGVECKVTRDVKQPLFKFLCDTHAQEQGFCFMCGTYSKGTFGYDQIHPGLCGRCFDDNLNAYR